MIGFYIHYALNACYALERGDWAQAAKLSLSPPDLAWSKFPQAEGILVFARGLGAARNGDSAAAREETHRLQALKEALTAAKNDYWASQTDFQIKTVNGWIALAEKRNDEALQLMRDAAGAEEASDKHPCDTGQRRALARVAG